MFTFLLYSLSSTDASHSHSYSASKTAKTLKRCKSRGKLQVACRGESGGVCFLSDHQNPLINAEPDLYIPNNLWDYTGACSFQFETDHWHIFPTKESRKSERKKKVKIMGQFKSIDHGKRLLPQKQKTCFSLWLFSVSSAPSAMSQD